MGQKVMDTVPATPTILTNDDRTIEALLSRLMRRVRTRLRDQYVITAIRRIIGITKEDREDM